MNREELKVEIMQIVDEVPEKALTDLLHIIQLFQKETESEQNQKFRAYLDKIIKDDHELLKKLAE